MSSVDPKDAARRVTWLSDGHLVKDGYVAASIHHEFDGDYGEIDCGWVVDWCFGTHPAPWDETFATEGAAQAAVEKALAKWDDKT